MGDLRARRPPARGRSCATGCTSDGGAAYRADELALREEYSHLRAQVANLRRENAEVQERYQALEDEDYRKDRALAELLVEAKIHNRGSAPAPGGRLPQREQEMLDTLDTIREDIQELLRLKREVREARVQLEERERVAASLREELRADCVTELLGQVADARQLAEEKARAFNDAEAADGAVDSSSEAFAASQQHQRAARELVARIEEVEGESCRLQQRHTKLAQEREKFEQAVTDHGSQLALLRDKHAEVERQQEQSRQRLDGLKGVEERHARLKAETAAARREAGAVAAR